MNNWENVSQFFSLGLKQLASKEFGNFNAATANGVLNTRYILATRKVCGHGLLDTLQAEAAGNTVRFQRKDSKYPFQLVFNFHKIQITLQDFLWKYFKDVNGTFHIMKNIILWKTGSSPKIHNSSMKSSLSFKFP